jgi:hypothetical protein
MFEKKIYVVTSIDGDYAHLLETENAAAEDKLVARALLPEGIREGSILEYEMMMYRLADN